MRTLRNLAYFAAGVFLAAAFMLGTTHVRASHLTPVTHPVRAVIEATVHKFHDPVVGTSCSAVMVAPERALTAAHCLNMLAPVLTIDGYDYRVTDGYADGARDIALLIVPGAPCPCAHVTDKPMENGAPVAVGGYPYAIGLVITFGEFQGRVVLPEDGQEYMLMTALVAPGNSGGGVFNEHGDLIAITSKGAMGMFVLAVEVLERNSPLK